MEINLVVVKLGKEELQILLDDTVKSFVEFISETIRARAAVVWRVVDGFNNFLPREFLRKT